jgi:hypothetical protein
MQQANKMTTTTPEGTFAFSRAPEDSVAIVASRPDLKPAKTEGVVTTSAPLEVTLILD